MEKIKEFYSELVKNDEFKTKLTQFRQENGDDYEKIIENVVLPQAKKMGYNFTKQDLLSYEEKNESGSLSDEELLNVAGGFAFFPQLAAITLGAIMSLTGASNSVTNFLGGQKSISAAPKTSISQQLNEETPDKTPTDQIVENNIQNATGTPEVSANESIEVNQENDNNDNIEDITKKENNEQNEDEAVAETPAAEAEVQYDNNNPPPLPYRSPEQKQAHFQKYLDKVARFQDSIKDTPDLEKFFEEAGKDDEIDIKKEGETTEQKEEAGSDTATPDVSATLKDAMKTFRGEESQKTFEERKKDLNSYFDENVSAYTTKKFVELTSRLDAATTTEELDAIENDLWDTGSMPQGKQKKQPGGKAVTPSSSETKNLDDEGFPPAPKHPAPIAPDVSATLKDAMKTFRGEESQKTFEERKKDLNSYFDENVSAYTTKKFVELTSRLDAATTTEELDAIENDLWDTGK